jgi:hypothetical protein
MLYYSNLSCVRHKPVENEACILLQYVYVDLLAGKSLGS